MNVANGYVALGPGGVVGPNISSKISKLIGLPENQIPARIRINLLRSSSYFTSHQ